MSKKHKKIKVRRTWIVNPVTKIISNKKRKKDKRLTTRDLMDLERGIK